MVGINELMDVLQKSGAKFGDSFSMKQGQLGLEGNVRNTVYGQGQGRLDAGKKRYMDSINRIAGLDQKLGGLYGDPSSKLFIENPLQRERLKTSPISTGYKQVEAEGQNIENTKKELEDQIKESLSLYEDITASAGREEAATKKARTESEKAGRKVVVKGKTGESAYELTKQQQREAKNARVKLNDVKALSEFFNKSSAPFRKYLADEGIDGKLKGDLDAKRIKEMRMKWESDAKKKKESEAKKKKVTTKTGKRQPLF